MNGFSTKNLFNSRLHFWCEEQRSVICNSLYRGLKVCTRGQKEENVNKKRFKLGLACPPCWATLRPALRGSLTRFVHIWSRLRKLVHGCAGSVGASHPRLSPFHLSLTLPPQVDPFLTPQPKLSFVRVLGFFCILNSGAKIFNID